MYSIRRLCSHADLLLPRERPCLEVNQLIGPTQGRLAGVMCLIRKGERCRAGRGFFAGFLDLCMSLMYIFSLIIMILLLVLSFDCSFKMCEISKHFIAPLG